MIYFCPTKNIFFILNSETLEQLELCSAFSIHQNNLYSQNTSVFATNLRKQGPSGIHKGIK